MMIDIVGLNTLKKIAITVLLLMLVIILDLISGNEISLSIFYLIPIAFITWYHNRNSGLLFSLISSVAWFVSDLTPGSVYSYGLIPYWNALVRLGFFIFITYLLSSIKNEREREKEIIQFIAHDLRSPLASILTSFKLFKEDRDEPLTKNQKELIDLSNSSGIRMMIFVNSLLDLGRLEKKKLHLNITKVNLNEIINSSIEQVYFLAKEKNIALKFNNSVDTISADGNLLLRILVNLISNAIKVSNKNTEVHITTGITKDKKIFFSIKDRGPGIQEELKNKIFEKYRQGNLMTSGSGIGLAFCKYAVEAHKGYIKVENNDNTGMTVYFVIPQHQI